MAESKTQGKLRMLLVEPTQFIIFVQFEDVSHNLDVIKKTFLFIRFD